jgi:hypothetical protein
MNTAALMGWVARQLDFVLAFPQAPVETDVRKPLRSECRILDYLEDVYVV